MRARSRSCRGMHRRSARRRWSRPAARPRTTTRELRVAAEPSLRLVGEPVACAAHGLDEAIETVRLERHPEPADTNIDRAVLDAGIAAPEPRDELLAAEDTFRAGHEELQHAKLGPRQRQDLIVHGDPLALLIEPEPLELDDLVEPDCPGPAQHRADSCQQLPR